MQKYIYYGKGRDLSKIIKILLYKKIISKAIKLNYGSEYTLSDNKKIKKDNIKIVYFEIDNLQKFEKFLENNNDFVKWNE